MLAAIRAELHAGKADSVAQSRDSLTLQTEEQNGLGRHVNKLGASPSFPFPPPVFALCFVTPSHFGYFRSSMPFFPPSVLPSWSSFQLFLPTVAMFQVSIPECVLL